MEVKFEVVLWRSVCRGASINRMCVSVSENFKHLDGKDHDDIRKGKASKSKRDIG